MMALASRQPQHEAGHLRVTTKYGWSPGRSTAGIYVVPDANGNPFNHGPSETPGVVADPVRNGDSGSIAFSVNKLRVTHAQSAFSSERSGHEAEYTKMTRCRRFETCSRPADSAVSARIERAATRQHQCVRPSMGENQGYANAISPEE